MSPDLTPAQEHVCHMTAHQHRRIEAKRSVEKSKDETQFLESALTRTRRSKGESPFRQLDTSTGFIPSVRYGYCAVLTSPNVPKEGLMIQVTKLLKTTPLPAHMKVITAKEFRNAPAPSAGSASDLDDYDFSVLLALYSCSAGLI
ncbi:hypothetical protein ANCCEY_03059 [Ancylostoma ceylanicum]|uniref:Uncharacterized protein n=1 Tax=Ancylostoma ceylanicum TaxID=53326 RepID=A0A0D6M329_9BILA|nr:hypothetical protein ANCCEY_03059 [Ancylostoma ceylanicum]